MNAFVSVKRGITCMGSVAPASFQTPSLLLAMTRKS
jgi:hypothetical protein